MVLETNGIPNLIKVIYDVLPNDLVKMLTEKYHINRFFAKRKVYKNINNFIKNDYVENIKLLELIDCYYDKKIVPLLSKMTRRKS